MLQIVQEDVKRVYNQFQNIFYMPSVNTTINIIYKIFYYYGYKGSHNKKSYILLIIIKIKEKESKPKKKKREKRLANKKYSVLWMLPERPECKVFYLDKLRQVKQLYTIFTIVK